MDVVEVIRIEELRSIDDETELRFELERLLDARRCLPLELGARHHVATCIASGRAAADVADVERIHVGELHRVVPLLVDSGYAQHQRLDAQIRLDHRVRRIAVGRDDGRVLRREDLRVVPDFVESGLVLARCLVDVELVHRLVRRDQGEAVDVSLLGDALGLGDARCSGALGLILLLRLGDRVVLLAAARDECRHRHAKNGHIHPLCCQHPHARSHGQPLPGRGGFLHKSRDDASPRNALVFAG